MCRKLTVTEQTFYRERESSPAWVAELRRPGQLEAENKRLQALVADLSHDEKMLQDVVSGNI